MELQIKSATAKFMFLVLGILFIVQLVSAGAIIDYNWNETHLIVNVTSPQGVGSAQVKLNISSDLTIGSAKSTGFMAGAMYFTLGTEHRWFQLSANGDSNGVIVIPITCQSAADSYEVTLIDVNIKDANNNSIALNTAMPMYQTINCFECDLNHDGIIIKDWNDLIFAYKCFLGIEKNCKINYKNWNLIKQEYQCFIRSI